MILRDKISTQKREFFVQYCIVTNHNYFFPDNKLSVVFSSNKPPPRKEGKELGGDLGTYI